MHAENRLESPAVGRFTGSWCRGRGSSSAAGPRCPLCQQPTEVKTCGGCGRVLPLGAFDHNRAKPDGLQSQCRACMAAHKRRWRAIRRAGKE